MERRGVTLSRIETTIAKANAQHIPVILVQHIANPASKAFHLFFNEGTEGVRIHPRILAAAPDAPIVVKQK